MQFINRFLGLSVFITSLSFAQKTERFETTQLDPNQNRKRNYSREYLKNFIYSQTELQFKNTNPDANKKPNHISISCKNFTNNFLSQNGMGTVGSPSGIVTSSNASTAEGHLPIVKYSAKLGNADCTVSTASDQKGADSCAINEEGCNTKVFTLNFFQSEILMSGPKNTEELATNHTTNFEFEVYPEQRGDSLCALRAIQLSFLDSKGEMQRLSLNAQLCRAVADFVEEYAISRSVEPTISGIYQVIARDKDLAKKIVNPEKLDARTKKDAPLRMIPSPQDVMIYSTCKRNQSFFKEFSKLSNPKTLNPEVEKRINSHEKQK